MYDYRLSPDVFWNLTFAQLEAIGRRYDRSIERDEFGPALITHTINQALGGKSKIADFMPSQQVESAEANKRTMTQEQITDAVYIAASLFGGEIIRGKGH